MDIGIIILIAFLAWSGLLVVVLAMCKASSRADARAQELYRGPPRTEPEQPAHDPSLSARRGISA